MAYENLGELKPDTKDSYTSVGEVSFNGSPVKLSIDYAELEEEDVLKLASQLISELPEYDSLSKDIISRDLRDTYNDNWRSYDTGDGQGGYKTVTNPELSEEEFKSHFKLDCIQVNDNGIDLWYGKSELFWGHSVFVQSLDGLNFKGADAQMFG